jgi:hypothetical protein
MNVTIPDLEENIGADGTDIWADDPHYKDADEFEAMKAHPTRSRLEKILAKCQQDPAWEKSQGITRGYNVYGIPTVTIPKGVQAP